MIIWQVLGALVLTVWAGAMLYGVVKGSLDFSKNHVKKDTRQETIYDYDNNWNEDPYGAEW